MLIGNVIETQFLTAGDWGFGSAISLIMAIIIMISLYITRRLDTTLHRRKGEEHNEREKENIIKNIYGSFDDILLCADYIYNHFLV